MSRPQVRPLTRGLLTVLVLALLTGLGAVLAAAPASAAPANAMTATATTPGPDPRVAGIELDTDLTLVIARCEGCVITLLSYDGANPVYSSQPATVTDGSVTITLPSARTAGMSVRVEPTWLSAPVSVDTNVVWRYAGTAIGDAVTLAQAREMRRASGCWAGTVNEAVTLTVKVRRVSYRGRLGVIAWAPVTESYVPPMERIRGGVLVSEDVLACNLYR